MSRVKIDSHSHRTDRRDEMGLFWEDKAWITGGEQQGLRRFGDSQLQFALDDGDDAPRSGLCAVIGTQGGRKRVLIELRRGAIRYRINHDAQPVAEAGGKTTRV